MDIRFGFHDTAALRAVELDATEASNRDAMHELGLADGLTKDADYTTLMYNGSDLIGYVHCSKQQQTRVTDPIEVGADYINIHDLALIQVYHGRGLCKRMMGYTLEQLKKIGTKIIKLWNVQEVVVEGEMVLNGISSCRCYIRAADTMNYACVRREKQYDADGKIIPQKFLYKMLSLDKIDEQCANNTQNTYYFFAREECPGIIKEEIRAEVFTASLKVSTPSKKNKRKYTKKKPKKKESRKKRSKKKRDKKRTTKRR